MNWIYLTIALLLSAGILYAIAEYKGSEFIEFFSFFGVVLSVICVVCLVISILTTRGEQVDSFEEIRRLKNVRVINEIQANKLIDEFKLLLQKQYPEFERQIFQNISPKSLSMYMVQYPQLKSVEGIIVLVRSINELKAAVYDVDRSLEDVKKSIRYRLRSPWVITWFVQEPDDSIKDFVYPEGITQ